MSTRKHFWAARFWHDWEPAYNWKTHWNWINFTLLCVDLEVADYDAPHEIEIHVALLGLHVEFDRNNREKLEALEKVIDRLHDAVSSGGDQP